MPGEKQIRIVNSTQSKLNIDRKIWLVILHAVCSAQGFHAQHLSPFDTVASYSLINTAMDATGMQGDAELVNAPFAGADGVYCNGVYIHSGDPDGSLVRTPPLSALYDPVFVVGVHFKFDSLPGNTQPVINCGDSWRYLGFLIQYDGLAMYNFNDISYVVPDAPVAPGQWHHSTIIYSTEDTTAQYWLDGMLIATVHGSLSRPSDDDRISNTHYGAGITFEGYLKNLTICSAGDLSSVLIPSVLLADQSIYPNPASRSIYFPSGARNTSWRIYDVSGNMLDTGVIPGHGEIDISGLNPGTYVLLTFDQSGMISSRQKFIRQ